MATIETMEKRRNPRMRYRNHWNRIETMEIVQTMDTVEKAMETEDAL